MSHNERTYCKPTEREFVLFQTLIKQKIGIHLNDSKRTLLGSRLWKRIIATDSENYYQYYKKISKPSGNKELKTALELITTNETFFFREDKHFQFLKEEIISKQRSSQLLRIWSAACSTGEEPYSIAMTLDDLAVKNQLIVASDVNEQVINQAKTGIYLDQRAHCVPDGFREKYFTKGLDEYHGYIRIKPDIRSRVNFIKVNLMSDFTSMGTFDLIFLRNVMIYFEDDAKTQLLSKMASCLREGGWLFTGHSESLHTLNTKFKCIQPAVYYKA